MRRLVFVIAAVSGLLALAGWWRRHRRAGTGFVNRVVNPWLERRGLISGSRGELGLIEHVGRRSGTVRRTPIHPVPTADGFRIIVPVGESSEWLRNVLAAGHCRLVLGDRVVELDEPLVESPADVPGLARPMRALFGWLGFRYLRLHALGESPLVPAETLVQAAGPVRLRAARSLISTSDKRTPTARVEAMFTNPTTIPGHS